MLTGAAFAVPSVARWRVWLAMIRHLRHLRSAGIGAAERSPNVLIGGDAAHRLEQQLIHPLVEYLSSGQEQLGMGATEYARRRRMPAHTA